MYGNFQMKDINNEGVKFSIRLNTSRCHFHSHCNHIIRFSYFTAFPCGAFLRYECKVDTKIPE